MTPRPPPAPPRHRRPQVLGPFLDELTDAAAAIGAVNTVTPRPAVVAARGTLGAAPPVLVGDNTDWIGICESLEAALRRGGKMKNSLSKAEAKVEAKKVEVAKK